MTIDTINISTYGLMLSYLDGHLNQPARKKILSEQGFATKDLKYESREPVITLIGKYANKTDLFSGIQALKNKIASSVSHDFVISEHGLTFSGAVTDGIKISISGLMAKVIFKVTIL